MGPALLIIDMQNDYFPGGKMELDGIVEASENVSRMLDHFRNLHLAIYHVQHFSVRSGATFFIPGTEGVEINKALSPLPNEVVITKNYPNSFRNTGLQEKLRMDGISELVICGAMSHMCIDATTRAAFDLDLKCTVIHDACATKSLEFEKAIIPAQQVHASFMASLKSVFAKVISADEYLKSY